MSDFYSILRQSIIDRGLNSPEAREEAYAQARRAMINRLWAYNPPLAEDEIDHRIGQFDTAVARIEDDVIEVFAAQAEDQYQDDAGTADADEGHESGFGGTQSDGSEDEDEDEDHLPTPPAVLTTRRALEERSLAVERALRDHDDAPEEPPRRGPTAYDADLAGWTGDEIAAEDDESDEDAEAVDAPPRAPPVAAPRRPSPAPEPTRRAPARQPGPSPATRDAPAPVASTLATIRAAASRAVPSSPAGRLRALIGIVAVLILVLAGGLAWVLLRDAPPPVDPTVVLQTEVPGGVSGHETAIRLPKEAIAVTNSFSLFDGRDPTVFESDPDNPVRFDGELARVSTSAASAGTKAIVGAGLSSRLAGRTVRVTIDARSAQENGATSIRFAYQSGVAISHWQTANLSSDFTELGLVWRVPALRTNPNGDYIIIEPGIPGSGTGAEIRSVRIDLVDP
jgi:hypothetical protein